MGLMNGEPQIGAAGGCLSSHQHAQHRTVDEERQMAAGARQCGFLPSHPSQAGGGGLHPIFLRIISSAESRERRAASSTTLQCQATATTLLAKETTTRLDPTI